MLKHNLHLAYPRSRFALVCAEECSRLKYAWRCVDIDMVVDLLHSDCRSNWVLLRNGQRFALVPEARVRNWSCGSLRDS